MAGKKKLIEDGLVAAMRAISERDAAALSRTGSDPSRFLPYVSNYRRTETSFYDPKYWSVTQDHLEYPEGTIVGTKDKLLPIEPTRRLEEILKADPELMYRGMSADELASFLRSAEIKSTGSYNMTGQEGLTYFTSDPDSAQFYANSFAPEGHKPNMERPAYVVAAKRAPSQNIIHVPGVAEHEIGVNRATPVEDVVGIYRGTTTDFDPGVSEKGLYVAPRASLNWEGKTLDEILKGRAEGGSVREGYAGKGRVVGDIVKQALELLTSGVEKTAPKVIGTDAAGRPMFDFRGAVVSHFTDPESASDIWAHGYRQVGDGYYGRAVSFTPNREYGRQFGGVETNAVVSPEANILDSGNPEHSDIIQRVLNDRTLAPTNPRPGQKTWDQKFRELGYDGLYDPGAGDLFIYNPAKVKPLPPEKSSGGPVREGYAGKGRVVSDTIGKALEVASEAFAPEKTVKAYKLFKQRDGKLYPLYVGANEEVPLGQWLKAKPGELLPSGKVKAEISGGLAYRPGWHAGDLPVATHIGAKSHGNPRLPPDTRRSDEVWAEVEMPDDVDWQSVANERARITKKGTPDPKTAHITDQVPYGGFYRYKTSPTMQGQWLIGGDMRVNRLLTDDEVKAINDAAGVTDLPRREGYAGGGDADPYADEVASAKSLMADKAYADQPWGDWAEEAVGNALLTAQKVLPTALGGTGEVGITDIARGAYEGGKDAVMFPGDVISGKQALYDEYGRPLEQAVGRSFNSASTVGGAASVVPRPANSLGVFGGIKARTADKNKLAEAQIMERDGIAEEEIYKKTGWFRGNDEQWRFEIPDIDATVDPAKFRMVTSSQGTPYQTTTLSEYLNHPEFFTAYPEFKNMPVNEFFSSDTRGYYMPRYERGTINPSISDPYIALNLKYLSDAPMQRSTLLHEIQHAIQQKEGFSPGSNQNLHAPDTVVNPKRRIYEAALANDPDMKSFQAVLNSSEYKDQLRAANELFNNNYKKRFNAIIEEEAATGKNLTDQYAALTDEYEALVSGKFPALRAVGELSRKLQERGIPYSEPRQYLTPFEAYYQTAGEVEARNVQERRDKPREELRETYPRKTQDYPDTEQLIDWNDTSWRKGYAGGRRVAESAIDAAIRIAREGLEGLAKNKGKTPREIGEAYGSQLPRVPFEEWRYEFEPTTELLPRKNFDPSTLNPGDVFIPFIGDRTSAGRRILSINDQKLATPGNTEGGPDYARGISQQKDNSIWASEKGAVSRLNKRIDNAINASREKGYKDPQAYGLTIAMSPQGGDFAAHVAETYMGMIPGAKISKRAAKEFDDQMRQKFPDWPGILSDKVSDYVVNADAGAHRVGVLSELDKAKWTKMGFPDVSLARYATTTPDLLDVPTEAAGYMIGRIDPSLAPPQILAPHRTYNTTIPGEYVGGLPPGLMRDDIFTQFSRTYDENPAEPSRYINAKRRSFEKNPTAFQVMEGRDIEDLIRKVTALKDEYADGGAVDEDIDDALRIARADGGANPAVMMEDAKGNKYDAQGNVLPPEAPTGPNPQRNDTMFTNAAPENYKTDVQPFIDYAVAPIDRPGMPSEPDLVDVMRVATQVAAEGQPTDDRGEGNFGRRRAETVRSLVGASPEGYQSDYKGPFTYNAGDTANFLNTLIDFSPYGALEYAHDIPYEAGRTGDYGNAAVEGGIGALMTAPGMTIAGRGLKKGYEAVKSSPKLAAGIAGVAGLTASSDEAEAGPARWFSKAMEVAGALPMEKMTGEQALAMLRRGVSPEELKWTGTDKFLTSRPQVTKGELLEHLKNNRVQVNEVVLGGGDKPTRLQDILPSQVPEPIRAKYRGAMNAVLEEKVGYIVQMKKLVDADGNISLDNYAPYMSLKKKAEVADEKINRISLDMRQEYVDSIGGLGRPTKYEEYSTAGGKGYRESLYQFGAQGGPPKVEERNGVFAIVGSDGEVMRNQMSGSPYTYFDRGDAERAAKSLYRESGTYKSPHWDDPDVLFHTRSQTLTYQPPGANRPYKVHNVEETQSDLAQAGRKRGFKDQDAMAAVVRLTQQIDNLSEKRYEEVKALNAKRDAELAPIRADQKARIAASNKDYQEGKITNGERNRIEEAILSEEIPGRAEFRAALDAITRPIDAQLMALDEEIQRIRSKMGEMPLMPYVGNTEGWTDLAIKKELDRALDSDADYFSWSPGEVHAERYDLSKHIGKVQYNPDDGSLLAYNPQGKMVVNESVNDPSDLDEYLGKELADKMRAEANNRRSSLEEYELSKDEDTGGWRFYLYGEPVSGTFQSKGSAKDYMNDLMANEFANNPVELSGLDLKVGGEGMLGYYNKIYLKRVQEVIKKATGIKPQIETITVDTADGPRQQLGIRITDEMREKARFSDFKKGGRVTGGNAYDNNQVVDSALALTREF